jgi:hypothetical protein
MRVQMKLAPIAAKKSERTIGTCYVDHRTPLPPNFGSSRTEGNSTPTYSSWLNQGEIWFSKIQRDVISRGVFTSVKDLARKLMRYIRNDNKTATPIRWIYKNVGHRIHPGAI